MTSVRTAAESPAPAPAASASASASASAPSSAIHQIAPEECTKAYSDVFGRPPPDLERAERRMAELERAIGLLPEEKKESVLRAMRRHPLLFTNTAHSVLFLGQQREAGPADADEEEDDFDARDGAVRMARYWEQRERMFGDAAFSSDCFAKPTTKDYIKYYERCLSVSEDTEADETMRKIAKDYVKNVREAKVEAMDRILERIGEHEKTALTDAQRQCPELVGDEHKLEFLKAEDWSEHAAARRMVRYWEMKYALFPDSNRRRRKITSDDLMSEYEREIKCGIFRLMPDRDAHGRSVAVVTMNRLREEGLRADGLLAALWYAWQAAQESTACRENGVVFLANYVDMCPVAWEGASSIRSRARRIITECLPVKIKALHVFFDSDCAWWKRMLLVLARLLRMRTMVYFGVGEETSERLRQYGVTAGCVPVELGGEVPVGAWEEWLAERKEAGL